MIVSLDNSNYIDAMPQRPFFIYNDVVQITLRDMCYEGRNQNYGVYLVTEITEITVRFSEFDAPSSQTCPTFLKSEMVNLSMDEYINIFVVNSKTAFLPYFISETNKEIIDPKRKVFENSVIMSKETMLHFDPQTKFIFLKKSPHSEPLLIGVYCFNTLVMYRPMFLFYLSGTPDQLWVSHFTKLIRLVSTGNNLPAIDTELTIGADPELALFESENIGNGEDEISSDIVRADRVLEGSDTRSIVGTDGYSAIFEIRPKAAKDAKTITEYIEKCIKIIVNKVATSRETTGKQVFLESGGGSGAHIGGHIHFGNIHFKNSPNYFMNRINTMMDDFIYGPIRRRMYGAMRGWSTLESCRAASPYSLSAVEKMDNSKKAMINYMNSSTAHSLPIHSDYDRPSQSRVKSHGFEYRSLPSFIASKEFTEIIFELAIGIGKLVLNSVRDIQDIKYERPVVEEGYMLFTTQEIFKKFMRYINGDKRNLFLKNIIKEWGIVPEHYGNVSVRLVGSGIRTDWADQINDTSLLINEALSDEKICFRWPVFMAVDRDDLVESISPRGETLNDLISSVGVFLRTDSLKRTVILEKRLDINTIKENISSFGLSAVILNSRHIFIGIRSTDNIYPSSDALLRELHYTILVHFIKAAAMSRGWGCSVQSALLKKWPELEERLSKFVTYELNTPIATQAEINPCTPLIHHDPTPAQPVRPIDNESANELLDATINNRYFDHTPRTDATEVTSSSLVIEEGESYRYAATDWVL